MPILSVSLSVRPSFGQLFEGLVIEQADEHLGIQIIFQKEKSCEDNYLNETSHLA